MTTTGTYAFSPALSRLVLAAYARIGIRGPQIVQEHMSDAELESNLLLVEWSNKQPNLWLSKLVSVPLTAGTATYTLDPEIVAIQMAYLTTVDTSGAARDRPLGVLSTVDYASQADKAQQGPPTSYWFNRQITPEVTLWMVPDGAATYTLKLRCVRQVQDAAMSGGLNVEIPYRFNTAFVDGLAARLGGVYPEAAIKALGANALAMLEGKADKSWAVASGNDTEGAAVMLTPQLGGYFR